MAKKVKYEGVKCSSCQERDAASNGLCKRCYARERYRSLPPEKKAAKMAYLRAYQEKHHAQIKEKDRLRHKLQKERDPSGYRLRSRNRALMGRFGITHDDYLKMLTDQGGVCAVCGKVPGKKHFHVEHDHDTGKIRGLLCFRCNFGLGWFQDDLSKIKALLKFLTRKVDYGYVEGVRRKERSRSTGISIGRSSRDSNGERAL